MTGTTTYTPWTRADGTPMVRVQGVHRGLVSDRKDREHPLNGQRFWYDRSVLPPVPLPRRAVEVKKVWQPAPAALQRARMVDPETISVLPSGAKTYLTRARAAGGRGVLAGAQRHDGTYVMALAAIVGDVRVLLEWRWVPAHWTQANKNRASRWIDKPSWKPESGLVGRVDRDGRLTWKTMTITEAAKELA